MMKSENESLQTAEVFSNNTIHSLRKELLDYNEHNLSVVVVGSFARRDASKQSDLDYFVISNSEQDNAVIEINDSISKLLQEKKIKEPSNGGAFGGYAKSSDILKNVGGRKDTTDALTRRLLFLLESEWLTGENIYNELLDELICKYVNDQITQHQLCKFLLNDLIRYYRTICVDFEYKTNEGKKTWGDRNIKLMFSRKLMFFSGILVVAKTAQCDYHEKREILKSHFKKTPIDRVRHICGNRSETALAMYSDFVQSMSDPLMRDKIGKATIDRDSHCTTFRKYKNKGHHFAWELSKLLNDTFDTSHPIHLALKF